MRARKSRQKVQDKAFEGLRNVNATSAKNNFGDLMLSVEGGQTVAISRHDETVGVLVPAGEYKRMKQATSRKLNLLTEEFDAMVAQMQAPGFAQTVQRVFSSMAAESPMPVAAAARAARHG